MTQRLEEGRQEAPAAETGWKVGWGYEEYAMGRMLFPS